MVPGTKLCALSHFVSFRNTVLVLLFIKLLHYPICFRFETRYYCYYLFVRVRIHFFSRFGTWYIMVHIKCCICRPTCFSFGKGPPRKHRVGVRGVRRTVGFHRRRLVIRDLLPRQRLVPAHHRGLPGAHRRAALGVRVLFHRGADLGRLQRLCGER